MFGRIAVGLALLLVAVCPAGCSRDPATARVSGTVTYRGQPLADAIVSFVPVGGGRPAMGETDSSGEFTLTTYAVGDGAIPGEHVVTVQKQVAKPGAEEGTYQEYHSAVPDRYTDVKRSDLRAEVTARGPNEFEFALTD